MDWQRIYSSWLDYMTHLDSQVDNLAPFDLVQLNARVLPLKVDWWPKSERSRYLDDLKNGSGIYWDTKKAHFTPPSCCSPTGAAWRSRLRYSYWRRLTLR